MKNAGTVMLAMAAILTAGRALADDRDSLPVARIVVDTNVSKLTPQFQTAAPKTIQEIKLGLEEEAVEQFNSTPHLAFFRWVDSAENGVDVAVEITLKLIKNGEIDPKIYLVPAANIGEPLTIKSADFFENENFILEGSALRDQMLRRKSTILTGLIISQRQAWHSSVLGRVSLCRTLRIEGKRLVIPIDASHLRADRKSKLEVEVESTFQTANAEVAYFEIEPRSRSGLQKCSVAHVEYDPADIDHDDWHEAIPKILQKVVPDTLIVVMRVYEPRVSSLARSPD